MDVNNFRRELLDKMVVYRLTQSAAVKQDCLDSITDIYRLAIAAAPAAETLQLAASAMKKLLPPALFAEVMTYLDPLGTFEAALKALSTRVAAPPALTQFIDDLDCGSWAERHHGDEGTCDQIATELRRITTLAPRDWYPIETAPRDGSWFWVKRENPPSGKIQVSIFKWDADYNGWFSGTGWWGKDDLSQKLFTHWRLLYDQPHS